MTIKRVTQLELENFAIGVSKAEEADGDGLLSVSDVRAFEAIYKKALITEQKIDVEEEIPTWADKFQEYLNIGIRGRIAAYMAWASMPVQYRWPRTQEQLAKDVLGLTSDRAIATWRKKYPEIDMMVASAQSEAMLEYRPGAFHALGTVAADPSYRANPDRRLFFEMSGDYTPRQKIETNDGKVVGRKMLDQLKKKSTAELLELLGSDALQILQELEDDVNHTEEQIEKSNTDASAVEDGKDG